MKVASTSCSCKDDLHGFFVLFFSGLTCLGGKIARLWCCRIENNVAADWILVLNLAFASVVEQLSPFAKIYHWAALSLEISGNP